MISEELIKLLQELCYIERGDCGGEVEINKELIATLKNLGYFEDETND